MSTASRQFNAQIFHPGEKVIEAEDFCDTVYDYRRSLMKKIRELAKDVSIYYKQFPDEPSVKNAVALLKEAEKEGQLIINYERGTIFCKPYQQIINEYITSPSDGAQSTAP